MIEIRNLTRSDIDDLGLQQLATSVLKKEKLPRAGLSIAFVGPKRMQEMNRAYRSKDEPTNVLSFPGEEFGLGEVIVCPAVVRKQAKSYGITYERAIAWMTVHGILHLLGYEHAAEKDAKKMERKEEHYLKLL